MKRLVACDLADMIVIGESAYPDGNDHAEIETIINCLNHVGVGA